MRREPVLIWSTIRHQSRSARMIAGPFFCLHDTQTAGLTHRGLRMSLCEMTVFYPQFAPICSLFSVWAADSRSPESAITGPHKLSSARDSSVFCFSGIYHLDRVVLDQSHSHRGARAAPLVLTLTQITSLFSYSLRTSCERYSLRILVQNM